MNTAALAELVVRHTRRHMPTRRVAVESAVLPPARGGAGALLIAAIGIECSSTLDDDDRRELAQLLREARGGIDVPRIAMRHRLQTDVHGLDTSRHRVVREDSNVVVELDVHGRAEPQILGAVMAISATGATTRVDLTRVLERSLRPDADLVTVCGASAASVRVRRIATIGRNPITLAGFGPRPQRGGEAGRDEPDDFMADAMADWVGVPAERRWAMEVLGIRAGHDLYSEDIHARFRRLVRRAHPDHGADSVGAAERIAELREARERLLAAATARAAQR